MKGWTIIILYWVKFTYARADQLNLSVESDFSRDGIKYFAEAKRIYNYLIWNERSFAQDILNQSSLFSIDTRLLILILYWIWQKNPSVVFDAIRKLRDRRQNVCFQFVNLFPSEIQSYNFIPRQFRENISLIFHNIHDKLANMATTQQNADIFAKLYS